MKSFPIETDEPCELCEGETAQQATQMIVLDGFRWFGSRLIVCEACKRQLVTTETNEWSWVNENCDQ